MTRLSAAKWRYPFMRARCASAMSHCWSSGSSMSRRRWFKLQGGVVWLLQVSKISDKISLSLMRFIFGKCARIKNSVTASKPSWWYPSLVPNHRRPINTARRCACPSIHGQTHFYNHGYMPSPWALIRSESPYREWRNTESRNTPLKDEVEALVHM